MLGIFANFGHVGEVAHHRDARTLVRADTGAIHLECIDFARGAVRQLDWLIVASPQRIEQFGTRVPRVERGNAQARLFEIPRLA